MTETSPQFDPDPHRPAEHLDGERCATPPLELTPAERSNLNLVNSQRRELVAPPEPPKSLKWHLRLAGLVFVPPLLAVIGGTLLVYLVWPLPGDGESYDEYLARTLVAPATFYTVLSIGALVGEIVGLVLWWRFTAPGNPPPSHKTPEN